MSEVLSTNTGSLIVGLAVAAILIAIGYYVISKVRNDANDNTPPSSSLLTNFHELYDQGELSDEEYREIKSVLAQRLQREIKDTSESG
jgi:uncharacterized membrane protein